MLCLYCSDTGMIDLGTGLLTDYGFDHVIEPCPYCEGGFDVLSGYEALEADRMTLTEIMSDERQDIA